MTIAQGGLVGQDAPQAPRARRGCARC